MQMEQIGLVFRGDYDLASMLAYLADAGFSHYDENLGDLKEVVIVHPLGPRADSGGDIGDFVDFADVFWELPKDVRAYISDYIDEEYVSVLQLSFFGSKFLLDVLTCWEGKIECIVFGELPGDQLYNALPLDDFVRQLRARLLE